MYPVSVFPTGGHLAEPLANIPYAIVVSRYTVRITLTLDALNDLPIKVADINNSYITAPVKDKICKVIGQYFVEDAGIKSIVVQYLYGLNSARADFQNHL